MFLCVHIETCSSTDDSLVSSGSIQMKAFYGRYNDIEINDRQLIFSTSGH